MARLNYMASRICAIISEWVRKKSDRAPDCEGLEKWWWTGIQNELVSTNHCYNGIRSLIKSRMLQWPLLVTPRPV